MTNLVSIFCLVRTKSMTKPQGKHHPGKLLFLGFEHIQTRSNPRASILKKSVMTSSKGHLTKVLLSYSMVETIRPRTIPLEQETLVEFDPEEALQTLLLMHFPKKKIRQRF